MTNVPFSLIKKKYASVAAATAASSATQGVVVFDKKNKVICVDGDVYGGNIQDVNYDQSSNQLVITKADGTQQTLDFSDVASASSTMAVFGQLRDTIGVTDAVQHVQGHYANTNYLQGAQTLIDADKALDSQIHTVQGNVQGVQSAVETVQGHVQGVQSAVETVQGHVQGVQSAVETVQGHVQGVQSAVETVQGNLETVASEAVVTVEEQATAETGYLKTYVVKQNNVQVGSKINIPKDFLVKSAEVKTVTTPDVPYEGAVVGDKYIDFVINVKEGTATDEHVYLPVKDLVQAYSVQQNATQVQLAIDANNVISATIVAGSIGTTELAAQGVTSEKIGVQAVEDWNIKDGAVGTDKIAAQGVTSEKIAAQGVTSEKIAAQGVQGWNIAQGAVTSDKLADSVVSTPQNTPEVVVNDDTQGYDGTTVATIAGKDIKVKSGMYWTEWSDDEPAGA